MTVTMSHFAPTKRQFERVQMPIHLVLGNQRMAALDWSIGGFRVPEGDPEVDGDIPLGVLIDCGDLEFTFKTMARRVHHDWKANWSGFQFVGLSDIQLDMLRAIIICRVAGDAFPLEEIVVNPHNVEALAIARRDGDFDAFGLGYTIARIAELPED